MSSISLRNVLTALTCAIALCGSAARASSIFWLQTTSVPQDPGAFPFFVNGGPGASGTIYLFGSSDTDRVGGIGFNVSLSNSTAMSFKGPASYTPQSSAAFNLPGGPISVTPTLVSGISGAALPPAGSGFGVCCSGGAIPLASWGYEFSSNIADLYTGGATISLIVGDAGVADYNGNPLIFHMGTPQSALYSGDNFGASAVVGFVPRLVPEPTSVAMLSLAALGGAFLRRCRQTSPYRA